MTKQPVTMDIECYKNYFLVMFKLLNQEKTIAFEMIDDCEINLKAIHRLIKKYQIITFNGIWYDIPVLKAALCGFTNGNIHAVSTDIIENGMTWWEIDNRYQLPKLNIDHIDIMNIAPLQASLKLYSGRLHCKTMMDLPIDPKSIIDVSQTTLMQDYCAIDLLHTEDLYQHLHREIVLRKIMSAEYKIDLRSKSDAQIAEAIFKKTLHDVYKIAPKKYNIVEGDIFKFVCPENINFKSQQLMDLKILFETVDLVVNEKGHIGPPEELKNKTIGICNRKYKVGLGGLHSQEKSISHYATDTHMLIDIDVTSFYPFIIIKNKLYPKNVGKAFLKIFAPIVKNRLIAKRTGDKSTAGSLKVVINGTFGKLAQKHSVLYAPDLLVAVTFIGQLSLLMLIEAIEYNETKMEVVSANTDGIIVKLPRNNESHLRNIVSQWEKQTNYKMEYQEYKSTHNRDVNNFINVTPNSECKVKGVFKAAELSKNPVNEICNMAVQDYIINKTPIDETILKCDDIRKFVTVRTVKGGAQKDGKLIGKGIRWYYGKYDIDVIRYITNNNTVPRSNGAIPCMTLPEKLPLDLDTEWYINESIKLLKQIGVNHE